MPSLLEIAEIPTVIVGTRWRGDRALEAIAGMKRGDTVQLVRETSNRHDAYAVACHYRSLHVGYIPRQTNTPVAQALDRGAIVTAIVEAPAQIANRYIKSEAKLRIYLGGGEPQL
jgi:HIRAN domain